MVAVILLVALAGMIAVREGVRLAIHGRPPRWRGVYQLATPVALRRRVLAIVAGIIATYLAVSALAYVHLTTYGWPTGYAIYGVGEVIFGSAADGALKPGDEIKALDGEPLQLGDRRTLVERVQAKGGVPIAIDIVRDGKPLRVTVTPRRGTTPSGKEQWLLGIRPVPVDIRSSTNAIDHALRYPLDRIRYLGPDIASMFESREPQTGSVVRITEEFRRSFTPAPDRALVLAVQTAGSLFLLLLLLDLVRLAIVIRDTLRAR